MLKEQRLFVFLFLLVAFTTATYSWSNNQGSKAVAEHQNDCRSWLYDEDMIPYYNYGSTIGLQRNPLYISGEVINHYENYKEEKAYSMNLVNNANWLVNNAKSHGNYSILEYKFSFPRYEMESPWRSALAQGKAVEALTKAYDVTNNKTYIDTAKSLLNSFFVEVKDGGVTLKTPEDGWWYEEYADDGANSSRVLNGMIWAVLSIYDYYKYTNDTNAKFLFDQGVLALKNTLPLYDNMGNSYYDIHKKPVTKSYHQMHINLLEKLFDITQEDIFKKYHDTWLGFKEAG
jgi:heparosan-N-sulfate-glucuronate 5-epimerase